MYHKNPLCSHTFLLLQSSEIGIYQQYGRLLSENPDSAVPHYAAGVERVRNSNGKYAFITESTSNDFTVNTEPCDTMVTTGYLFTRPYAVALPKNSSLK